jgi:hypothetical protein
MEMEYKELTFGEMDELIAAHGGTDGVRRYLADKKVSSSLITATATSECFNALTDEEVPADLRPTLAIWRGYAGEFSGELSYDGPVAWRMPPDYTLKQSAPKSGPCREDFQYLQNWDFNDEPTKGGIVFWIPRLIQGSKSKTAEGQMVLLAKLRNQLKLPKHHLTDFGSAAMVAGLILAHFKRTGERVPLNLDYVRTTARFSDGKLLNLGCFGESGLRGGYWWRVDRDGRLGVFGLGVELGR